MQKETRPGSLARERSAILSGSSLFRGVEFFENAAAGVGQTSAGSAALPWVKLARRRTRDEESSYRG
jgi:hypothetical protein